MQILAETLEGPGRQSLPTVDFSSDSWCNMLKAEVLNSECSEAFCFPAAQAIEICGGALGRGQQKFHFQFGLPRPVLQ